MVRRRNWVRLMLLALLVCMCGLWTGCNSGGVSKNTVVVAVKRDQNTEAGQRQLENAMQAYVTAFREVYPDIQVQIRYMNEMPVDTKGIDCMLLGADDMLAYVAGDLADLSGYYAACGIDPTAELLSSAVDLGRFGSSGGRDAVYFQAFNYDRACIYVDTEMLDAANAAGVDVTLPGNDWTYTEFLSMLESLTYQDTETKERYCGIYMPYYMSYVWHYFSGLFGNWYEGITVTLDQGDALYAMQTMLDVYQKGWARSYQLDYRGSGGAHSAMSMTYACAPNRTGLTYEAPDLIADNPGANAQALLEAGRLRLLPLPAGDDGRYAGSINTDFVQGFAVPETSSKKDAAAKFALFSVSEAGQKTLISSYFGGIPVRKALWEEDFWRTGLLAGDNADAVLVGIESDTRDDFTAVLQGDAEVYTKNIRMRTVFNAYLIREFRKSGRTEKDFREMLSKFVDDANKTVLSLVSSVS